jgi:S-(hydroxymethyl)glutathione dehydrogenase/alcohol dehydrogenase
MPALIGLVTKGAVSIQNEITKRYGLDGANEAFEAMKRGEIVGRAIVEF